VLEQAPDELVDAAVAELAAGGAPVVRGWEPRAGAEASVCVGRVENTSDAAAAVLAAVRGARLVVDAHASREVVDQLCDDLGRLGPVDHRLEPGAGPVLSVEERDLLAHLLAGKSLGQTARVMHLSRRTADRRLATARKALGAATTDEALRRATEIGITPAP
jgi:DNA-binding CsgD family transcriptional regulator